MPEWVRSSACVDRQCVEAAYVEEPEFRKSSHSMSNGTCVEAAFVKSSHSSSGACVEAAPAGGRILVRDSKDQAGPVLVFTPAEWSAFLAGVRGGEFDFEQADRS